MSPITSTEGYAYDYAGRLNKEIKGNQGAIYTYDPRGNLLSSVGSAGRMIYDYSGDRMTSLISVISSAQNLSEFTYDNLGRMTSDGLAGQTFSYNSLDLIGNVSRDGATLVNYFYLADGTKTRALDGSGEGLVYRGPFVYRKGSGSSSLTLESAAFGGGRLTPDGALLYVTDYLGSVRAVNDGATGQIYKAVDYSAYGDESEVMVPRQGIIPEHTLAAATLPSGMTLRDSFTGQEDQTPDFGTSYTDFGARQYSPVLRRWMTPDPLSEKYYGVSPYAFCNDNPVNIVDTDGEAIGFVMDVISVGCGVYNLVNNLKSGNTKAAWGDVAGIGLDLVCAVIPGVTINAGTAKTLAKSSAEIADRVVDAKGAWNLNPFDRGKSIEATLKGWGTNFPVIDKFDKTSRTITSIKSLDLNAKSYQSGNAVFNRVKGYIDKLAGFQRGELQEIIIESGDFDNRVLELAIPEGATSSQLEQLKKLKEYAQEQSIQLTIVLAK